MGWCSGTTVFDAVCEAILPESPKSKLEIIKEVIETLEDADWDCHGDSNFYDHPIVRQAMKELHPSWDFGEGSK